MSNYYISYKQAVPWNGAVFDVNEYRRAINEFYSKIDLANPNFKTDADASLTFDVPVRDLSPNASFPNEWGFDLSAHFSTTVKDETTGLYKVFLVLSGDVRVPRVTSTGNTLRVIIAAANKNLISIGNTPAEAFNSALVKLRNSLFQDLADQISNSGKNIKIERQLVPFTDPEPALAGPPTQTISGVTNKAPVVDNPNIKLPTQEVKSLTATSATQAVSDATASTNNIKSQANGTLNQAQGAVGGLTNQAQGAVGNVQQSAGGILSNLSGGVKGALGGGALGAGIGALAGGGKGALIGGAAGIVGGGLIGTAMDKLNPKGIIPDGLGKNWSPDKFSPEAIAGNTKFVDPKTGVIGSTEKIASAAKSGILAGGLGAGIGALAGGGKGALIGGLSGTAIGAGASLGGITGGALVGGGIGGGIGAIAGGGKGALIGAATGGVVGAAAAKLASVQKGMPKPNIPKPLNTPRIKTVKIPRPDSTKGAEALLNLPKSPLG